MFPNIGPTTLVPLPGPSPSPSLTSLFKASPPLADAEVRDALKVGVDKLKAAQEAANLRAHLEEVSKELGSYVPTKAQTVEQLELFEDWAESAAKIDPDEEELARVWQRLLSDMVQNKKLSSTLLRRARQLSPDDARTLLRVSKAFLGVFIGPSDQNMHRLVELGFISESRFWVPAGSIFASLSSFIAIYARLRSFYTENGLTRRLWKHDIVALALTYFFGQVRLEGLEMLTLSLVLGVIVGSTMFIFLKDSARFFRVTSLGRRLLSHGKRARWLRVWHRLMPSQWDRHSSA